MVIQSHNVYIDNSFKSCQIDFDEDIIKGIYEYGEKEVNVDYGDLLIVPGFYDIHSHGGYGYDALDINRDGLLNWLENIKKEGVCGIYITLVSNDLEHYLKAIELIKSINNPMVLGIHLEGPYLSSKYKGAQNEIYLKDSDVEEFIKINKDKLIKIITLAPERDKNHELIKYCKENNIAVSLGHSGCDYKEAYQAYLDGATGITHCFNGMSGFKHRGGGLVNFALSEDIYSEVIGDGRHVETDALKIFFKCKKDKAITITDSIALKGMPEGSNYIFGGNNITLKENLALLDDGTIAGSTLKLNEALKILVNKCNISLSEALNSMTINPMKYLGINNRGLIKESYKSNIVVLNSEYDVIETYISKSF